MRKPKLPRGKSTQVDKPPPGGRAWARVQQFAVARGLPLEIEPDKDEAATQATKGTSKQAGKGSTKRAKTIRRSKSPKDPT